MDFALFLIMNDIPVQIRYHQFSFSNFLGYAHRLVSYSQHMLHSMASQKTRIIYIYFYISTH